MPRKDIIIKNKDKTRGIMKKKIGDPMPEISGVDSNNEVISIFRDTKTLITHSIYLTEEISNQKNYTELFNLLRNAKEDEDLFLFYINNFGGMCHTGIELINSMRMCDSNIFMTITGPIYSMAPLIALQADKIRMEDHTFMMFHDYSGGTFGKGSEMEASIKAYQSHFKECFYDYCKGFLTNKEMNEILNGKDLYLSRSNCEKRLKKMGKLI